MSSALLLALVGLLYVLVFGGLSLLWREQASVRLAIESVVMTTAVAATAALTGAAMNPAIFLALLYVVTMRVRLMVDLGNLFARRHNHAAADRAYRLALRLWPDTTTSLLVQLNQGVLALHAGHVDKAIAMLKQVAGAASGVLSTKHESACHYNLGVAYLRKGQDAQATVAFNEVLEAWPASEYARYAAIALERRKHQH